MFKTKLACVLLGLCASLALIPTASFAQQKYPNKPSHLLLGYAAGSRGADPVNSLPNQSLRSDFTVRIRP